MSHDIIKNVSVIGAELINLPSQHIEYIIEIKTNVRSWKVKHRYSEFYELDLKLKKIRSPLPEQLPGKSSWFTCISFADPAFVEDRQIGIEVYLRGILLCSNPAWRESNLFNEFLLVPISKNNNNLDNNISSEGWLKELKNTQNIAIEIRSIITKREQCFNDKDLSLAHQLTAQARKLCMTLTANINELDKTLTQSKTQLTPGEELRRRDILSKLEDEKSVLNKLIQRTSARENSNPTSGRSSVQSDRGELFNKPISKRKFGKNITETKETKALDNEGLLQLQKN
ncbi:hypothetical protein K502DRAFT_323520, partial [Neoconidiobolus thromboides FSU 785]